MSVSTRWLLHPWVTTLVPAALAVADALLANDLGSAEQMGTSLLAAAALLLRRRWPVVVLLLTMPGMQLSYIWLAPMLALYTVATCNRRRWVVGLCALLVAVVQFVPWPEYGYTLGWDRTTVLSALYSLLTAAAPVALGLLVQTRRELAVRIDELTRGQEREQALLAQSVLSMERARLAREMHDVVSHQVSLISIQAGALQVRAGDPVATAETARTIRLLSVKTLEELRQMVGVLRAAGGDGRELTPQPTLADLPRLVGASGVNARLDAGTLGGGPVDGAAPAAGEDADTDTDLDLDAGADQPVRDWPVTDWPEPVQRAAYRTVQEALTNVRKHAPGSEVSVRLRTRGDSLVVQVRNGPPEPGAEPLLLPGGGHGLIGLRERAQQLGGTLESRHTWDGGFVVQAELPRGTSG